MARDWATTEGEVRVSAIHDRLGTVELRVTLQGPYSEASGSWRASASIYIDAGALPEIARGLAAVE